MMQNTEKERQVIFYVKTQIGNKPREGEKIPL